MAPSTTALATMATAFAHLDEIGGRAYSVLTLGDEYVRHARYFAMLTKAPWAER